MSQVPLTPCGGGGAAASYQQVPPEDVTLNLSCDSGGVCTTTGTARVNTPAGQAACVNVDGQSLTIKVLSATASTQEVPASSSGRTCTPIVDDTAFLHNTFVGLAPAYNALWRAESGTVSSFSSCGAPDASTAVCTSGLGGTLGAIQSCGASCGFMYTGSFPGGSCGAGQRTNNFIGVCYSNTPPTIYVLDVVPDRSTLVENLDVAFAGEAVPITNNTFQWRGTAPIAFDGYGVGYTTTVSDGHVSKTLYDDRSCTGYCGFSSTYGGPQQMGLNPACVKLPSSCTANNCRTTVQRFEDGQPQFSLPATDPVSGATLAVQDAAKSTFAISMPGSGHPVVGTADFTVNPGSRLDMAARAPSLATVTARLYPNPPQYYDVVLMHTPGDVATASSACAFRLLDKRGEFRLYTMYNLLNRPSCDLIMSNGPGQRTLDVNATAKAANVQEYTDTTALWEWVDWTETGVAPVEHATGSGNALSACDIAGIIVGPAMLLLTLLVFLWAWCSRKRGVQPVWSRAYRKKTLDDTIRTRVAASKELSVDASDRCSHNVVFLWANSDVAALHVFQRANKFKLVLHTITHFFHNHKHMVDRIDDLDNGEGPGKLAWTEVYKDGRVESVTETEGVGEKRAAAKEQYLSQEGTECRSSVSFIKWNDTPGGKLFSRGGGKMAFVPCVCNLNADDLYPQRSWSVPMSVFVRQHFPGAGYSRYLLFCRANHEMTTPTFSFDVKDDKGRAGEDYATTMMRGLMALFLDRHPAVVMMGSDCENTLSVEEKQRWMINAYSGVPFDVLEGQALVFHATPEHRARITSTATGSVSWTWEDRTPTDVYRIYSVPTSWYQEEDTGSEGGHTMRSRYVSMYFPREAGSAYGFDDESNLLRSFPASRRSFSVSQYSAHEVLSNTSFGSNFERI